MSKFEIKILESCFLVFDPENFEIVFESENLHEVEDWLDWRENNPNLAPNRFRMTFMPNLEIIVLDTLTNRIFSGNIQQIREWINSQIVTMSLVA